MVTLSALTRERARPESVSPARRRSVSWRSTVDDPSGRSLLVRMVSCIVKIRRKQHAITVHQSEWSGPLREFGQLTRIRFLTHPPQNSRGGVSLFCNPATAGCPDNAEVSCSRTGLQAATKPGSGCVQWAGAATRDMDSPPSQSCRRGPNRTLLAEWDRPVKSGRFQ